MMAARRTDPTPPAVDLTAGQAQYVIARLISERRVSAKDVERYASEMNREIAELEQRLQFLRRVSGSGTGSGGGRGAPPGRGKRAAPGGTDTNGKTPRRSRRRRRRHQNLSPERRAELKKQGQYLALMRPLSKTERDRIKGIVKSQGMDAALATLRSGKSG